MSLFLTELTKDLKASTDLLTKAALAIPKDKLEWTPGGKARTTIDILCECAGFPQWIKFAVQNKRPPTEAESKSFQASIIGEIKTTEGLTDILKKETQNLVEFITAFPEAKLTEEITFPWGTYTIAGSFGFHYWNNTYHLGQLNYLQLILGDTEMHL